MKLQFTIFNCISVLFLSLITITLSAQDGLSIKPLLIKKNDSNQSLLHKKHNLDNPEESKSSFKLYSGLNNNEFTLDFPDTDQVYFEVPIGVRRTITSRGDYGNLYFVGLLGFSAIYTKFNFSMTAFGLGWGKTKEGIQYYHETLDTRFKTFGGYALTLDIGYDISPIKKIRFSPIIGLNFASFTEISGSGDRGLIKYDIEERWIPQVGFDIYRSASETNWLLMKLKYRYTNISKKGKFVKGVNISKHIIALGINIRFRD